MKTEQQQQWRKQGVRMERRTVSTWGTEYEIQDVKSKVQEGEYRTNIKYYKVWDG